VALNSREGGESRFQTSRQKKNVSAAQKSSEEKSVWKWPEPEIAKKPPGEEGARSGFPLRTREGANGNGVSSGWGRRGDVIQNSGKE